MISLAIVFWDSLQSNHMNARSTIGRSYLILDARNNPYTDAFFKYKECSLQSTGPLFGNTVHMLLTSLYCPSKLHVGA
jgi:hypothetical protein